MRVDDDSSVSSFFEDEQPLRPYFDTHDEPKLCGFQGRKALVRHWENCIRDARDGTTAAEAWRNSQRFASYGAASMVELLRYLFMNRSSTPYTEIHQRLVNVMINRTQTIIQKLERVLTSSPDKGSDLLVCVSERLTEVALELLAVVDVEAVRPLIDGIVLTLRRCNALKANNRPTLCPAIFGVCTLLESSAHQEEDSDASDISWGLTRMAYEMASNCTCQVHLPSYLAVTVAGLDSTSPTLFMQAYAENSQVPDVHQCWLAARPDRLLLKLLLNVLTSAALIDETDNRTMYGLHIPSFLKEHVNRLGNIIGSCPASYAQIKHMLILLSRLSIGVCDLHRLSSIMAELFHQSTLRPEPIESVLLCDGVLFADEKRQRTSASSIAELCSHLIDLIRSPGGCASIYAIRLMLAVNMKRLGDPPLISALAAFYCACSQANSSTKSPSLGQTSRKFFVQRLGAIPITNEIISCTEDRHLSRLSTQVDLWDCLVILSSPTWIYFAARSLLEIQETPYSVLSNDHRDSESLIGWMLFLLCCPLLLRAVPVTGTPAFVAIRNALCNLSAPWDTDVLVQTAMNAQVASRKTQAISIVASTAASSAEKIGVPYEKLIDVILHRSDPRSQTAMRSCLPPSWNRMLPHVVPSKSDQYSPLKVAKDFLRIFQEVSSKLKDGDAESRAQSKPLLSTLHTTFKQIHCHYEEHKDRLNFDSIQAIRAYINMVLWRSMLTSLFAYLIDGIHRETTAITSNFEAVMINFLLMQFRTDRFRMDDDLPLFVLDCLDRLRQVPRGLALVEANHAVIVELFSRWTVGSSEPNIRQTVLVSRLRAQAKTFLNAEEQEQLSKFLNKRRRLPDNCDEIQGLVDVAKYGNVEISKILAGLIVQHSTS